jgi:flagellar hook assembly protein FlgD
MPAGPHTVPWDGRDESGLAAASGVYMVRLEAAGQRLTIRAVLVR